MLPFSVVPGIYGIDNGLMGLVSYGASYVVRGSVVTALVEVGTSLCVPRILTGLEVLGISPQEVGYLLCTHIHMDHAGAAGHLLEHCPNAQVIIHSRSHRHLVSPERLMAGVAEAVGPLFSLYGEVWPVDPVRMLPAEDVRLDLGDGVCLESIPTPGHSRDHLSYYVPHARVLFAGDAAGVSLFGHRFVRPVTAPPHFSLEGTLQSLETMRRLEPAVLCFTHFGARKDPATVFEQLERILYRWDEIVRTEGLEAAGTAVLAANLPPPGSVLRESEGTFREEIWRPIAEMNQRGFLMAYGDETP